MVPTLVTLVLVVKVELVAVVGVSGRSFDAFDKFAIGDVTNVVEKREVFESNARGGSKGAADSGSEDVEVEGPCPEDSDPCLCRPSIWSGSGEGI